MDLVDVFGKCAETLDELAYYDPFSDEEGEQSRRSIMCRIYFALIDDDRGCNALGNNLHDAIEDVKEFLQAGPRSKSAERDIRDLLFRLYLVVERVYEALQVIGLKEERFRLSTDGMRALREVKQWANFFKHPGAFLWCHNPTYICLSLDVLDQNHNGFVVDQTVVNDYYVKNEKKQKELHEHLSNASNVIVVFPDLVFLTKRFCQGIDDFCQSISAPFFRDILRKKSTIDDYFESFEAPDARDGNFDDAYMVEEHSPSTGLVDSSAAYRASVQKAAESVSRCITNGN